MLFNCAKKLFQLPIKAYQFTVSPLLGGCCRFSPSCSNYALQAIEKHGVINGIVLMVWRLLRCHPWNNGEQIDIVPQQAPIRFKYWAKKLSDNFK